MSSLEPAERVQEVLERLADALAAEVDVEVDISEGSITGRFVGEDVSALIGPHGQTLDAIQHLTYRIAYQGLDERGWLTVDADGYRERRAAALRATADQAADAALSSDRPVPLEVMSALERRLVHEHLKDRHDIETYSEGQEPRRHLVVAPLIDG